MPSRSFFVTDLHGHTGRYEKLFRAIAAERPPAVFLGGDLLPTHLAPWEGAGGEDFIHGFLAAGFAELRKELGNDYPAVLLILGNDDPRSEEEAIVAEGAGGLWQYIHGRRVEIGGRPVYGYACVPPTPFRLKDWERYDVSRYVDPGCTHPTEGIHSVPFAEHELRYATIKNDLERLVGKDDVSGAVFLFHTPPHNSLLDRAALDGIMVEHAPLDVHVGSVAVRRFIEARQPLVTLHGHIHESARITGFWKERIGRTTAISAAHDGSELSLVRLDLDHPEAAERELV